MFKVTITDLDTNEVVFEDQYGKELLTYNISRPVYLCRSTWDSRIEEIVHSPYTTLSLNGRSFDVVAAQELATAKEKYPIIEQSK
jgi:hypothetical protein